MVRPATTLDVDIFKEKLRYADKLEIDAGSEMTPEEALLEGIQLSIPCYVAFWKGEPLCIYGVVPTGIPGDPMQYGNVWMFGTDLIDTIGIQFLRSSRAWFDVLMEQYDGLGNAVDARNTVHIKWLEWLGFEFLPPVNMGVYSLPFIPFYRCNVQNV